tara:strand:- start:595 stop:840 length:246 start_codon:yes stop_codon:yes gene_type:complete
MSKVKRLATKALKDKPKWKPSKGYKYLEDCEVGEVVKIPSCGLEAIKIVTNPGQTTVIVTECPDKTGLGKRYWGNQTEVKV